ncbi:MAG: 8-oxo-dGTP pyrophosphatase MutT, NUDIX family [Chloroflexi bacterium]|nr:MAG: 8-oxo-dGTP pyrophosphatase MutT, NUDIX family [Chloroflexota bacterium]
MTGSEPVHKNPVDCRGTPLQKDPDQIGISTSGIIYDRFGYVLLQKGTDIGWWDLPGGRLEIGGNLTTCIVREVLEETNIIVRAKAFIAVCYDLAEYTAIEYTNGKLVQHVTALFLCEKISGYLIMSNESTDLGYYDPQNFPTNILLSTRLRVKDTQEFSRSYKGSFNVIELEK